MPHAERAQPLERLASVAASSPRNTLSVTSSSSRLGSSPRRGERAEHGLGKPRAGQLRRRDIDRDAQPAGPARGLGARLADHPVADLVDQAGILDDRDEQVGRNVAARRMAPAQQRLAPDLDAARGIDDRLIGQRQPVARGARCGRHVRAGGDPRPRRTCSARRRHGRRVPLPWRDTERGRRCASIAPRARRRPGRRRCRSSRRRGGVAAPMVKLFDRSAMIRSATARQRSRVAHRRARRSRIRRRRAGRPGRPRRPTASSRRATSTSNWSPIAWPSVSLTSLKRSRSTSSSAQPLCSSPLRQHRFFEQFAHQQAVGEPGQRIAPRRAHRIVARQAQRR